MSADWRLTRVAPEQTHHLIDGQALYGARFLEVLKFHAPGLAPALDDSGAFHISLAGEPAYSLRFERTFGFYEGLSGVDTGDGWHHILPDGARAYVASWAWCGNFQGGRCAVRSVEGRYAHITRAGDVVAGQWRYAGDYRDGIAVVQREDGRSSHIGLDGELIHDLWFEDLDVFHKGFARARDRRGWMHVDSTGNPLYARRFANAEPFYNGQARVERYDGGLEIIDETGKPLTELRAARRSAFAALSGDLVGYWRTDAIAAAVEAGLFESLPGSTQTLADQMGVDQGRLEPLLRGMVELGLVERRGEPWCITEKGAFLQKDSPRTLADAALEYAGPLRSLWRRLPSALADPGWQPPDVFGEVAGDADRVVSHHRMLRSYARHDYPSVPLAMQLAGTERVLDVGGGVGVLAGLLLDQHPGLSVVVLDRPEVISQLPGRGRISGLSADLLGDWKVQADVAVLARVVHDWPDAQAVDILERVRRTLPQGGRVFLVEMLVRDDGLHGGLCDLHLLLATGGRERTESEYKDLLGRAGLEWGTVRQTAGLVSVIEGVVP